MCEESSCSCGSKFVVTVSLVRLIPGSSFTSGATTTFVRFVCLRLSSRVFLLARPVCDFSFGARKAS